MRRKGRGQCANMSFFAMVQPQLQPAQAADILNERVRQVGRLNVAIADWLQVRQRKTE